MARRCVKAPPTARLRQDSEARDAAGLPTGPSRAPVTASLVVGAAPGARAPPMDNPLCRQSP